MKQLLFPFSKSTRRKLRLLPDAPGATDGHRGRKSRREPLLERLANDLLRAAGCREIRVIVEWNPRLRTTAGLACWATKTISLNPRLVDISQAEVQRTLRHELAHFLAQQRAGRRRVTAHGPEWRQACRDLGIPRETRCHNLPFKRTRIERRHFYACRACGTQLARVRPLRRAVACIRCCRKHNAGRYHEHYRFVEIPPPSRIAA